ncbi:MAG: hypothetical protein IKN43_02465 [Selenomonadaceae bacterium]|nr:hypothetical protein [Selenomonadaceae bacterium]
MDNSKDYLTLLKEHNQLLKEHNKLLKEHKELLEKHIELQKEFCQVAENYLQIANAVTPLLENNKEMTKFCNRYIFGTTVIITSMIIMGVYYYCMIF